MAQLQIINEEDPVIFIQLTDVAALCEEVLPLPGQAEQGRVEEEKGYTCVATIPELLYFILFSCRIASWWTGGGCVCGGVQVGMDV